MTPFIITAIAITVIVTALLIMPLVRTRGTRSYARPEQNIHYARERLQELDEQLKNASISATDYEALKLEIETTLADDIELSQQGNQQNGEEPHRSNKVIIGLLSACLPLAALGFYLLTGSPESLNRATAASQAPQAEQIDQLIAGVEQRLAENPDDLRGWALISRTYLTLGRLAEARDGFLKVLELGGESATTYASLADVTALLADGVITEEASRYVDRSLALDPNNHQALWLAGLNGIQQGNKPAAKQFWGRLLPLLSDMPQQQQELREIMLENLGELAVVETQSNTTSTQTNSATDPEEEAALTIRVSLSPELDNQVQPNQPVFVFARAKSGPPAPLAVKRLTVADLPARVTLSDADAMMPQLSLSKFEQVVITARVSKSGQPTAQSGDLQSSAIESSNKARQEIEAVISEVVP